MLAQIRKIQQTAFSTFFYAFILLISSCAVKNSFSQVLGIEFNKPSSPSKSAGSGFCHAYNIATSAVEAVHSHKKVLPVKGSLNTVNLVFIKKLNCCTKEFKGLLYKVPLYVLFKKIKYFIC